MQTVRYELKHPALLKCWIAAPIFMDWTLEVAAGVKIVEGDKSQLSEYIEYEVINSMWITNKGRQVIKGIKVNTIVFDLFYIA